MKNIAKSVSREKKTPDWCISEDWVEALAVEALVPSAPAVEGVYSS